MSNTPVATKHWSVWLWSTFHFMGLWSICYGSFYVQPSRTSTMILYFWLVNGHTLFYVTLMSHILVAIKHQAECLFIAAFIAVGAGERDEILESPVFQLIIFLFSSHTLKETEKIIEFEFILFQTPTISFEYWLTPQRLDRIQCAMVTRTCNVMQTSTWRTSWLSSSPERDI